MEQSTRQMVNLQYIQDIELKNVYIFYPTGETNWTELKIDEFEDLPKIIKKCSQSGPNKALMIIQQNGTKDLAKNISEHLEICTIGFVDNFNETLLTKIKNTWKKGYQNTLKEIDGSSCSLFPNKEQMSQLLKERLKGDQNDIIYIEENKDRGYMAMICLDKFKWKVDIIKIYFYPSSLSKHEHNQHVLTALQNFNLWKTNNLKISWEQTEDIMSSHVRIQFSDQEGCSKSCIGNQADLMINAPTTSIIVGFATKYGQPEYDFVFQRYCVHEWGHVLGFYHTHSDPEFLKLLKATYVKNEYLKEDTYKKIQEFDPNSVMNHYFDMEFNEGQKIDMIYESYPSEMDKSVLSKMYPK